MECDGTVGCRRWVLRVRSGDVPIGVEYFYYAVSSLNEIHNKNVLARIT